MDVVLKQWATQKEVQTLFSIGRDRLADIATAGFVRVDYGQNKKGSKKLYCCDDIDKYLKAKSAGKNPRVMRGKK